MSVLVVGVSHKSAPVAVLERFALDPDGVLKVMERAVETDNVSEAVVVSTCNRVEIYAEADRFHGSVDDVSALLVEHTGLSREQALPHMYVHYEDAAVGHLFSVVAGLDSMVVGESQILGQVRAALQRGQTHTTVGPVLNMLFQQALRIGKRGHAETGIDAVGPSIVSAALKRATVTGPPLGDRRVLIIGAGAMAGLSAATVARHAPAEIVVVNRTREAADRLAVSAGGRAVDWDSADDVLAEADLVVSCTGSTGVVLTADRVARAASGRTHDLVLLDLALPHDVAPDVADLEGVQVIGLAELAETLVDDKVAEDVRKVRGIVAGELGAFLSARSAARVTPTVVALRTMATDVVEAELERLHARRPELDGELSDDVAQTVRRVVDKLLHTPTVRIKELAGQPDGISYADALADLFALDQSAVEAVTAVDPIKGGEGR